GHSERETPGHIPNPEAKPLSADGTALETVWESRTPPDKHSQRAPDHHGQGPFVMPWSERQRPAVPPSPAVRGGGDPGSGPSPTTYQTQGSGATLVTGVTDDVAGHRLGPVAGR